MKKPYFILLLTICSLTNYCFAQSSPFKASVLVGVNRTQVDGDLQYGYHKTTYTFGVKGGFRLAKNFDVMTELLYSHRGTVPTQKEISTRKRNIHLNLYYAEVPILATLFFSKNEYGFYQWSIIGGVSYGRLIKSQFTINQGFRTDTLKQAQLTRDGFNTNDFSLIIGANRYITHNIGIGVRHTFSLNTFYTNPKPTVLRIGAPQERDYTTFRSFYVSFNIFYDFLTKKPKIPKGKRLKS